LRLDRLRGDRFRGTAVGGSELAEVNAVRLDPAHVSVDTVDADLHPLRDLRGVALSVVSMA
jgi:hypothetical protein